MFRYIIYAIFIWQLVAKISSKKVCEKMQNNSTLEKVFLVCKKNADLLRLVGATFDSKVASLRRIRKENLIILKSLLCVLIFIHKWRDLQFKVDSERQIFFEKLFMAILLTLRVFARNLLSGNRRRNTFRISFWCLAWDSNPGFSSNKPTHYLLDLNNDVYCDLRNKSACLNTVLPFNYLLKTI